jgi:signal transduction histidine kinase
MVYEAEFRMRSQEGKYRWFLSRGFPMRDDQGSVLRWFGICTDIDDFKRSQEQLSQATKMEAVGRLAGGVAHDFNNLLIVILGYANILSGVLERRGESSSEVQQILYAAERAAGLTRQLLTFSRQQIVQPCLTDLNSIVHETEALLRRLIGEDIVVRVVLDSELLPVRIDRGQMEQVIVNLAVNARDAMPSGGHLILETANVDLDEPYVHGHLTVEPGRYVMLVVSDTGKGMDHETQAHIFEPFFTTKGPGKGTGLGLSTVYGIIKQSGGHIGTYSEPGQGTTFKIYLPAVLESGISPQQTDLPSRMDTRGAETILVLEDEVAVRKLVQAMLGKQGYTILEADNPVEALRQCKEHAGPIDLLVTDVVMPGMGGRQVAELAVQDRPALKVLYMSGYTSDAIAHHGVLESGVAFLQKPFSSETLLQRVREVLNR